VKREALRRALRISVLDGCAYSLMAGGAESYLSAFAVFLGVPAFQIGLLSSVPQLVGSAVQVAATAGARLFRSLKRWVVVLAYVQAAVLAATASVVVWRGDPFLPLLAAFTAYWTIALSIGPAWVHWMGVLLPPALRAHFFARRNRVLQVFILAGLVGAGVLLERTARSGATALGFVAILIFGGAMRFVSATFLALQAGPPARELKRAESFAAFLRRLPGRPEVRLLPFLWCMNFAVSISAAYFTPYMLKELGLSYWTFMAITGTAFLAKSVAMGPWGRAARRLGARRAFLLSAVLITPSPALWAVSGSVPYLVALQVLSGAAWAGFELCQLLLFYDLVEEERLSDVFSYFSLGNGVAVVAGTTLGGFLLHHPFLHHPILPASAYHGIFVFSSLVRLVPLFIWLGALRRMALRQVMPRELILRVAAVRPEWGSLIIPAWWRSGTAALRRARRRAREARLRPGRGPAPPRRLDPQAGRIGGGVGPGAPEDLPDPPREPL
jgi:predicted MFS family arabinose efflux permease